MPTSSTFGPNWVSARAARSRRGWLSQAVLDETQDERQFDKLRMSVLRQAQDERYPAHGEPVLRQAQDERRRCQAASASACVWLDVRSRTMNVEPRPTSLSTRIWPRCASTSILATARPRPVPRTECVAPCLPR